MPSKKTLTELPNIETLRRLAQSLAMLDAIMSDDWESRYSSFNSIWNDGEMMASARNGGGDEYFILFNQHGAIIKGFAHESAMNLCDEPEPVWKGVLEAVPQEFQGFLQEPAFRIEDTTFCIWRLNRDGEWKIGEIEYPNDNESADGSDWLLFLLDGKPETYCDMAKDYYEREIDCETVKKIYRHEPLTEETVKKLNSERDFADLNEDINEIGYPRL